MVLGSMNEVLCNDKYLLQSLSCSPVNLHSNGEYIIKIY